MLAGELVMSAGKGDEAALEGVPHVLRNLAAGGSLGGERLHGRERILTRWLSSSTSVFWRVSDSFRSDMSTSMLTAPTSSPAALRSGVGNGTNGTRRPSGRSATAS